ncbi:MAG: hypothetical protein CM1200mP20_16780 [Pseudomonadota bacterium]|nr:MAG: hypothetical protein CM1200mP20_16780 [Pseudomonadota bacterium]
MSIEILTLIMLGSMVVLLVIGLPLHLSRVLSPLDSPCFCTVHWPCR